MGGLLVAFLDGTYSAPVFRSPEAAGASAKGPGCRYYMEAGGCRPAWHTLLCAPCSGAGVAGVAGGWFRAPLALAAAAAAADARRACRCAADLIPCLCCRNQPPCSVPAAGIFGCENAGRLRSAAQPRRGTPCCPPSPAGNLASALPPCLPCRCGPPEAGPGQGGGRRGCAAHLRVAGRAVRRTARRRQAAGAEPGWWEGQSGCCTKRAAGQGGCCAKQAAG